MSLYCPYCLTQQSFNQPICGNEKCKREIPLDYINNARQYPPIWLATFGFPGHGKTNAINSMMLHIENIGKIADASHSYLDIETVKRVEEISYQASNNNVNPTPTPQESHVPEPLLISLDGFPDGRTSTLVMYDLAGQAATNPDKNHIRAIQNVNTAWFIVSLIDLEEGADSRNDNRPRTINGLFTMYRNAMRALNISITGKTILVNYTKADLIILSDNELHYANALPNLKDYIFDDPWRDLAKRNVFELAPFIGIEYQQELQSISTQLREFTLRYVPGGRAFINEAERRYNMTLEFCVTSATGGHGGNTEIQRHRVLDPLLWSIYLNDRVIDKTLTASLITDIGLYDIDHPMIVYNAFSSYGANIVTYHIGEKSKKFDSGQAPSKRTSNAKVSLIGPIIDSLDRNTIGQQIVVLLLQDSIPLDLYDFRYTSWEDRIHIITKDRDIANGWPNRTVLESDSMDISFIIDGLIKNVNR